MSDVTQRYALMKCMTFFRDELAFGDQTERVAQSYQSLRTLCADALGKPTLTDLKRIEDEQASASWAAREQLRESDLESDLVRAAKLRLAELTESDVVRAYKRRLEAIWYKACEIKELANNPIEIELKGE